MDRMRTRLAFVLTTTALALGGMLAGNRPATLKAGGVSHSGKSLSATGTFSVQQTFDRERKQVTLEAAYWIDYSTAKLYATVPQVTKNSQVNEILGRLTARDLLDDFKLAPGARPQFLMNTAGLGASGAGSSVLFVIETASKQVAVYWCYTKQTGLDAKPEFDLVQVSSYADLIPAGEAGQPVEAASATGPVMVQFTLDKVQVPQEAIYWVESSARGARLFAAIPEIRKVGTKTQIMSNIAVRNVAADFKLKPGTAPRLLLNTASLGALALGTSSLVVIDAESKQVAIYRSYPRSTVQGGMKPEVELLQIKEYEESAPPLPPGS